jgi:hypothetical protein
MIALAFALAELAASPIFVPPPYNGGNLGGTYAVTGTEPDGKVAPPGTAIITRVDADRYRMTETISGATYDAVCLRARDVFTCGWGGGGRPLGVGIYERTSDGMTGTWWEGGDVPVGRERLVGGGSDLSGYFTIAKGERPDGTAYTGYATNDLLGGIFRLAFHTGNSHRFGFGLREGDLLTVGWNSSATCGVVTYRILGSAGSALSGRWIDPSRPNATGTETLTRI